MARFALDRPNRRMLQPEAEIFGVTVTAWPRWVVLFIGTGGVFVCFLLNGIAHEHLIKRYHITGTFFLTFIQFLGYSALSLRTGVQILTRHFRLAAPIWAYLGTSLCLTFSMSLTNYAAVRLSYATGVVFKSCKLIPVMIGNVIVLHKRPSSSEILSVFLIVFGLISLSLGDLKGKNNFHIGGIVAISVALICGATASNMEDKVMSQWGASQHELISRLYSCGAALMLLLGLVTGEMQPGLNQIAADPWAIVFLLLFSILGAVAVQFVYLTMKVFGSLVTVMVTSVRRALTVCLSFLVFRDKVFTTWHAVAMIVITVGMSINVHDKTANRKDAPCDDEKSLLDLRHSVRPRDIDQEDPLAKS
jgi:adenosine 3'-phospho 5'-phosphosulfate transporter B3